MRCLPVYPRDAEALYPSSVRPMPMLRGLHVMDMECPNPSSTPMAGVCAAM